MSLRTPHVTPELLNKVTKALGITALDQWYYVSRTAVAQAIGSTRSLSVYGGSVASFLKYAYPLHQFDEEKLRSRRNQERDQKFIEVIIRKLFPNVEIHTKARKSVGIINPETNQYLEIDFWIPSLKLGIEFQDKHHFEYQWYANRTLEEYQKRDSIKKETMASLGYTLITIGYWWDRTAESVIATIRKQRPDLLQEHGNVAPPIPPDPPPSNVTSGTVIPGVTGLMSPFIPVNNFDPTNWYAGEKHDGIRGVYNPELNKMFSRSGNELSVLPSLLRDIPKMLVEGEITAGRGSYSKTAVVSFHSHHEKVNWPMFRYVLFDIPDSESGDYTQRYSAIACGLAKRPFIFAQSTFRVLIVDTAHLKVLVDAVLSDSGEGMIIQKDSQYEYGRAKSLAKIKVRRDADAQVLRIDKHSCSCKLVNGVTTDISFCNDLKPQELKTGDIVSYYHNGYTRTGKPRQGEIYKVRYDLTWEQLVSDKEQNATKIRTAKEAIGSTSLLAQKTARNKTGHWNRSPNVRAFFDEFAQKSGFDPLVPNNWYTVSLRSIRSAGSGGLLPAYGFNMKKVLSYAYPELKFEREKFRNRDKTRGRNKMEYGYWNEAPNVRAYFDAFASSSGFDPLVAENWYPVRRGTLQNAGGSGALNAHDFNLANALSAAYPEVKFVAEKFRTHATPSGNKVGRGHWTKQTNVRAYFDKFAATNGFDPLVPNNWYSVRTTSLHNAEGSGLLKAFGYSLHKALSSAYPELKFEAGRFRTHDTARGRNKVGYWNEPKHIRTFCDKFAKASGFDSLVPDNWYPVRIMAVRKAGGGGMLGTHGHSLSIALSKAYPELKFESDKFRTRDKTKT